MVAIFIAIKITRKLQPAKKFIVKKMPPLERGGLNDCLPYKKLADYLAESVADLVVSPIALVVVSTGITAVSTVVVVTLSVTVVTESPVPSPEPLLLQDATIAPKARITNTFFIL